MRKIYLVLLTLGVIAGCSNSPNSTQDGGLDGTAPDTMTVVPVCNPGLSCDRSTFLCSNDASTPADNGPAIVPDASGMPLTGTCAMPIDLNARGTHTATGTTITGNNTTAPNAAITTVVGPSCGISDGVNHASNSVVFSYHVTNAGFLVASTDQPGSDESLDTIVWIVDACGSSGHELGCNDDGGNLFLSITPTLHPVAAGATVFVIVSTFGPESVPGTFELSVQEFPAQAAGAACTQASPFCVDGYTCVPTSATATDGTCQANGAADLPCRTTAPFCNTGLGCSVTAPTELNNGICQTPIAMDGVCTAMMFVCQPGQHCTLDPDSSMNGHCRTDGAADAQCNLTAPFCTAGLTCSAVLPTATNGGVCQVAIVDGALCTDGHFVCVNGDTCIPDPAPASTQHCIADGANGGICRL